MLASVGTGFSSIVVSNGRCYTMGNRDRNTITEAQAEKGPAPNICGACSPPTRSTDKGQQLDIVYCFDAETGKEIWRHIYPSPLEPKGYEGGPSATPTVADGKVYTISKDGKVFCLDASTGDVIWEKT